MDKIDVCIERLKTSQKGFNKKKHNRPAYDRKTTLSLEEVFPHVGKPSYTFDGEEINMKSSRYVVFRRQLNCVACGCPGSFFAMERNINKHGNPSCEKYHLNLYAVVDNEEVLMTKDHIVPKSLGGRNHIDNYQTMCRVCNSAKGNNESIRYE